MRARPGAEDQLVPRRAPLGGYGEPNRRGWNFMAGASYDFTKELF